MVEKYKMRIVYIISDRGICNSVNHLKEVYTNIHEDDLSEHISYMKNKYQYLKKGLCPKKGQTSFYYSYQLIK